MKVKIEDLKFYEKNAKDHPSWQIEKIKRSIQKFGFRGGIKTTPDLTIVIGHGRVLALKELGHKEVEVEVVEDLKANDIKAYRIADNKTAESDWLKDLLRADMLDLKAEDYDLLDTGFDEDELEKLFGYEPDEKDDIIPESAPPVAKLGDLWGLGRHRLLCGDSTKENDVGRLMGEEKADMVYNDPPYGMFLDADFSGMVGIGRGKKYRNVIGDHNDFNKDLILKPLEFFNYCREIFLWGGDYYAELLPDRNAGSWIVWDKMQSGEGVNDNYDKMFGSNFELCWSKARHKRALARVLWKGIFGLSKEVGKKRVHPTQKPVELSVWFIEKFSKKNNIIVDVFLGSGSTLLACEKMDRKCYGMELDPKYIDVIIKRWEDYTGEKAKKL